MQRIPQTKHFHLPTQTTFEHSPEANLKCIVNTSKLEIFSPRKFLQNNSSAPIKVKLQIKTFSKLELDLFVGVKQNEVLFVRASNVMSYFTIVMFSGRNTSSSL